MWKDGTILCKQRQKMAIFWEYKQRVRPNERYVKDNVLKCKTEHLCMHLFSVLEDHVHMVSKMTHAVADQLFLGIL